MDPFRSRFVVAPLLVACAAALALQHGVAVVRDVGLVVVFALALLALWRPVVSAVALPSLLYAIPPAPREIGLGEVSVATLALALLLGTAFRHRSALTGLVVGRYRWIVASAIGLMTINAGVALLDDVRLVEWLRGIAPFSFLVLLLPLEVLLTETRLSARDLMLSVCVAGLLFGGSVLAVFVSERLWEDTWWVYDAVNADWFRIATAQVAEFGNRATRWGPIRVTQLLPRATDPLVGIGVAVGCLLFATPSNRLFRFVGFASAVVAALAVSSTVTRSYMGALVLGWSTVLAVLVFVWWRGNERNALRRYLAVTGTTAVVLIAFLMATGLDDQIAGRVRQATETLAEGNAPPLVVQGGSLASQSAEGSSDENLHARVVEYRIAWRKFLDAPVFGNGLGTTYTISYPVGGGHFVVNRVAYVHNWLLYALMTGGVVGLIAYAFVLGGPLIRLLVSPSREFVVLAFCAGTVVLLSSYGFFFAVFRLISFNVILAMCWAAALASPRRKTGEA